MESHSLFARQLFGIGRFVRSWRTKMRFGKQSRAHLRLLELKLRGSIAECDWLARPPDAWDLDLPAAVGERNAASQALEDAIAVRHLLFSLLPEVQRAEFRVYRASRGGPPELIIAGAVTKDQYPAPEIQSLAMRAKLCGFQFSLTDGVLDALELQGVGEEHKA